MNTKLIIKKCLLNIIIIIIVFISTMLLRGKTVLEIDWMSLIFMIIIFTFTSVIVEILKIRK